MELGIVTSVLFQTTIIKNNREFSRYVFQITVYANAGVAK
jgi:hypothetical protein